MDVQFADLVTVALLVVIEGLLSADNALVMAIMVLRVRSTVDADIASLDRLRG